jgi:transposase-like protein
MTFIAVRCPHCHSEQIIKRGKTARGTQRYLCQNALCTTGSFLLDYRNRGCVSEVKQQIIDMSLNQWSGQKSGGDSAVSSEFLIAGMIFHPSRVKS